MITQKFISKGLFLGILAITLSGCTLGALSVGPQIMPSSTTVSTGQNMTFQVSGGTPPYQFQSTGVGTVDNSGNYQAGNAAGQSQIQATDASGNSGSATVSVVQSSGIIGSGNYGTNESQYSADLLRMNQLSPGWTPTSRAELKKTPLVQGQVIAVGDSQVDPQGDEVHSKFIKTNLKHPLIRLDELMEGKEVVAVHAVVEDQFLVKLQPGYVEADLSTVLASTDAHISKRLTNPGTYLISMNKSAATLSSGFLAHREMLKHKLKVIASVSPNFISRAPASKN